MNDPINMDRKSATFLESARLYFQTQPSFNSLVQLADRGITRTYLDGLRSLGYRFSPDELISLMDHGITIRYLTRLTKQGCKDLSARDLIELACRGVR